MKEVKCPNCGGDLKLDDDKEYYFCACCGVIIPTVQKHLIDMSENTKPQKN